MRVPSTLFPPLGNECTILEIPTGLASRAALVHATFRPALFLGNRLLESVLCLQIGGFGSGGWALGRLGANLDAATYWLCALATLFDLSEPQFSLLSKWENRAFVRTC